MKKDQDLILAAGIGAGLGIAAGTFFGHWLSKHQTIDADYVLQQVKKAFTKEGPIEGSWIQMHEKPLQKFAIKSKVYTGGITRIEDGHIAQYEFIADAHTGSVLDIYRIQA